MARMFQRASLFLLFAISAVAMLCMSQQQPSRDGAYFAKELGISIGGHPVIALTQPPPAEQSRPAIIAAEIVPGMGMNVYQLRAWLPGKGVVDMLEAPPIEKATHSARTGGGLLLPWANRIRGKLSADANTLEVIALGKKLLLPANRKGKEPNAERHSIHGLFLSRAMDKVNTRADAVQAAVTGSLDAGDFEGHWLSRTQVTVTATLKNGALGLEVVAKNTGNEPMPMAIGWHPSFLFPSGERAQVRLRLPGRRRALVNNYDDVFPTGKLEEVKGTPYDFSAPGGAPLNDLFLDECFLDLQRNAEGHAVAELVDPAARYGLRIRAISPEARALQVFAPLARKVVAIEPQFNLADPFGKVWDPAVNTGMVTLGPGQSVTYSVRVELFVP